MDRGRFTALFLSRRDAIPANAVVSCLSYAEEILERSNTRGTEPGVRMRGVFLLCAARMRASTRPESMEL